MMTSELAAESTDNSSSLLALSVMSSPSAHPNLLPNSNRRLDDKQKRVRVVDQCLRRLGETPTTTTSVSNAMRNNSKPLFSSFSSTTDVSIEAVTAAYAPPTLEKQFLDLYRLLRPALLTSTSGIAGAAGNGTNAAAFIQGTRGSGKTLLLNQVLAALRDENRATQTGNERGYGMFRVVYLHGLVVPGHSISSVVREILQQLTETALRETAPRKKAKAEGHPEANSKQTQDCPHNECETVHQEEDPLSIVLRLKQTSFSNQLQMLTEIMHVACVDNIPFLFILDELDTFVHTTSGKSAFPISSSASTSATAGSGAIQNQDRQVLLYHLLDRVATQGSLCSLVGLTCDGGIMTKLEKRIKSRAEGTAKFFFVGRCLTFSDLSKVVCHPLNLCDEEDVEAATILKREVFSLFEKNTNSNEIVQNRIYPSLFRQFRLGKDTRWFRRVLYHALSLYREDIVHGDGLIAFRSSYLEEALVDMGGSISRDSETTDTSHVTDRRMQALADCQGPSVAVILAARRILVRDINSSNRTLQDEVSLQNQPKLTLNRILQEYKSSYKGQSSNYSERILKKSFTELLQVGILRPAADHSCGDPLQYQHRDDLLYSFGNMDFVDRMPLHMPLDIHREVKSALDSGVLNCTTALREWGRKTN